MSAISNMFYNLDFIGPNVILNINSKPRYATISGAILSVLCLVTITTISMYFVVDLFERDSPDVTTNTTNDSSATFDMRYFNLIFTIPKFDMVGYLEFTASLVGTTNRTNINVKMCNQSSIPDLYKESNNAKLNNGTLYCLDNSSNYTLYGNINSLGASASAQIKLSLCANTTANGNYCKSTSQIQSKIDGLSLYMFYTTSNVNHLNISSPLAPTLQTYVVKLSSTFIKTDTLYVQPSKYSSDDGYVFQDKSNYSFYDIVDTTRDVDLASTSKTPLLVYYFKFGLDQYVLSYTRTYIKLQQVVASIGGIVKGITIIAVIINECLISSYFNMYLGNILFDFNNLNEPSSFNQLLNSNKDTNKVDKEDNNYSISNNLVESEMNKDFIKINFNNNNEKIKGMVMLNPQRNNNNIFSSDHKISKNSSIFQLNNMGLEKDKDILDINRNSSKQPSKKLQFSPFGISLNNKQSSKSNKISILKLKIAENKNISILDNIDNKEGSNNNNYYPPRKNITLSFSQGLCYYLKGKTDERINKIIDKINESVKENFSIEKLISKFYDIEKLKFTLLNPSQIKLFSMLPIKNFDYIADNQFDNNNYNIDDFKLNNINDYWLLDKHLYGLQNMNGSDSDKTSKFADLYDKILNDVIKEHDQFKERVDDDINSKILNLISY